MADPQLCGYGCGKPWTPWAGSRLIGHGRCSVAPDEAEALLRRYEADDHLTVAKLAAERGSTRGVVNAVLAAARKRRIEASEQETG